MAATFRRVIDPALSVIKRGNFIFCLCFGILLMLLLTARRAMVWSKIPCYSFGITEQNLPNVILLWALVYTGIYTYFFLLFATYRNGDKTFTRGSPLSFWFHSLFILTIFFSLYVGWLNLYPLFQLTCHPEAVEPQAKSAMPTGWLPTARSWVFHIGTAIFGKLAELLSDFHLLFLVILWSLLDLMIAVGGNDFHEKEFFKSVFCVVDLPVIFSMIFVEFMTHFCLVGIPLMDLNYLRAGVVAFQLIAGGVAICMMEVLRPDQATPQLRAEPITESVNL